MRLSLVDTYTLVNLVSETRAIPEFVTDRFRADLVAPAVERLFRDDAARAAQISAMDLTMARLGRGGEAPGVRAARSVLAHLA